MNQAPRRLERSSIEAYLFALVSIALAIFPMTWLLKVFGFLVMAALLIDMAWHSPITFDWRKGQKIRATLLSIIIVTAVGYIPILSQYKQDHPTKPDLFLRLVNPGAPSLMLINNSDLPATAPYAWAAIWNLDLSTRRDSIPFPTLSFPFIRSHEAGGPMQFFDSPADLPLRFSSTGS
jgi:hypothetical protein